MMSAGERGPEGKKKKKKEEDKVLRDRRGKWRVEDSIHWETPVLISEVRLRTGAVGSCEGREEIQDRSGGAEGTWDVEEAKHEMFIFSKDGANQTEADLRWRWEILGNGGWPHIQMGDEKYQGRNGAVLELLQQFLADSSPHRCQMVGRPTSEATEQVDTWATNVPPV